MPAKVHRRHLWQIVTIGSLSLAVALSLLTPRPAAAMPPRPPRPPRTTAVPAPHRTLIALVVTLADAPPVVWSELWTVVQWQDATGGWHDVAGWRGTLDTWSRGGGKKTWVVEDKDLGDGPFRWLVYDHVGGVPLAASAAFDLPALTGDVLEIGVTTLAP